MFTSSIRKTSCAAALCLVGLLAFDASAADVQYKGDKLTIKFDKQLEETIYIVGADEEIPGVVLVGTEDALLGIYVGVSHISVKGGPMDDALIVDESLIISGHLNIKTGAGDDYVRLAGFFSKNVKVNLGKGDDVLQEGDGGTSLIVGGSCTIKAGAGDDEVDIHGNMLVFGSMSVDLGKGLPDNGDLHLMEGPYEIAKTLSVRLSKQGDEDAVFEDVTASKLIVRGGNGHNQVNLLSDDNVFGEATYKKIDEILLP